MLWKSHSSFISAIACFCLDFSWTFSLSNPKLSSLLWLVLVHFLLASTLIHSLLHQFSPTLSSHPHSNPLFFFHPYPPFLPLLSQGANSLLFCSWRTVGNNGGTELVVVATGRRQGREGGRRQEREGEREDKEERQRERAGTKGMLVVSWAAGKRALANYTRFYAHRN